ncbi:hypothetical protein [Aliarcobacter butzleri]|uniref:hypothetical protein n=1 Tax=Aliarcobacter butzleri TaxID=28197 RepID=UPI002B2528C1|nr:hypothetical protein [Aliarcobacter butzleri]
MEKAKEFYSKHCCPIGKTRPTLEQMEEYIKQGKQTVAVNISDLEMKNELSKIILDNCNCKFFLKKPAYDKHFFDFGVTRQGISTKIIILDSYDEDKIKKAFDENMFIDVKNLNDDDRRKVMCYLLNYSVEKNGLPEYIVDEFYVKPQVFNTSDEANKIMKNSQDKRKKRDFRKLEFKHNNPKFR